MEKLFLEYISKINYIFIILYLNSI